MHFDLEQVKMFRAPTARTNVAYHVVKIGQREKKQDVEATVLAMVQRKTRDGRQHLFGCGVLLDNAGAS